MFNFLPFPLFNGIRIKNIIIRYVRPYSVLDDFIYINFPIIISHIKKGDILRFSKMIKVKQIKCLTK